MPTYEFEPSNSSSDNKTSGNHQRIVPFLAQYKIATNSQCFGGSCEYLATSEHNWLECWLKAHGTRIWRHGMRRRHGIQRECRRCGWLGPGTIRSDGRRFFRHSHDGKNTHSSTNFQKKKNGLHSTHTRQIRFGSIWSEAPRTIYTKQKKLSSSAPNFGKRLDFRWVGVGRFGLDSLRFICVRKHRMSLSL